MLTAIVYEDAVTDDIFEGLTDAAGHDVDSMAGAGASGATNASDE